VITSSAPLVREALRLCLWDLQRRMTGAPHGCEGAGLTDFPGGERGKLVDGAAASCYNSHKGMTWHLLPAHGVGYGGTSGVFRRGASVCPQRRGERGWWEVAVGSVSLRAKRYAARRAMEWLVGYLRRNPGRALDSILSRGKRLAVMEAHRRQVEELAVTLRDNPAMMRFVRRLALEVHPNQHRGVVFNWFVNSALLGIPVRYALAERLGHVLTWVRWGAGG